jgi:hypothetical protein
LIAALGWGMLDGAGTTAAEAGTLQSVPSPIAIAAILNVMKRNSPLLSDPSQAPPGGGLRKGSGEITINKEFCSEYDAAARDRLQWRRQ